MQPIQIVRYAELQPCKTAFIDAHTPGSHLKENFTIIGGGVSESPDQHVHIRETANFNIGAAGQPPRCTNSLHSHTTAEVFFVLHGRWRFFMGRYGDAAEVILEAGDIFNIPTQVFRGFENIGQDYGMLMAILGGDDAGGGVLWAPEVIQNAKQHGLILGENGRLYDTMQNQQMPDDIQPMPLLTDAQLAQIREPQVNTVVPKCVARYLDLMAYANSQVCNVIGQNAVLQDTPGFEVDFINHNTPFSSYTTDKHEVLMPLKGHWQIETEYGKEYLYAGDTCLIQPNIMRTVHISQNGESALYRVRNTDDPAGLSQI